MMPINERNARSPVGTPKSDMAAPVGIVIGSVVPVPAELLPASPVGVVAGTVLVLVFKAMVEELMKLKR